jgi:tetratricopeptide (TPR) repeat protein
MNAAVVVERVDAAAASAASSLVDDQHPWLGLDSFSEETREFFHGREEEVAELARRVQRKTLAILFGQSGLGKTSILRAGIVPRLRREGYCPVYVRIDYSRESPSPSEQIKQAIFRATEALGKWTKPGSSIPGESLWEFLHHRDDVLKDPSGDTLIPLLIFDQFEEIFTLGQTDDFGRKRAEEFIEDFADLVENRAPKALEMMLETEESIVERFDFDRADYRMLIALREDYLPHLEGLKGAMPSITQNRMRLARMTGHQALAAVMKPGGKLVSEEVAESIVRFVAGGSELRNAEVEPSLLSLVCRELNNARIAQGRAEISADLLAGSRDTILNEFYERALSDQPPGVRRFIEDEMLTESGFRESLAEERVLKGFAGADAMPAALALLVNRRLLRVEERLDQRRVEITHDVLCPVVKASRDARHEREAREEAERQLVAQRAREEATKRSLVRTRYVAIGCAVLALGALASAIFGYMNMKRAQEAEAQALKTRALAESARGEAEKLIVFLLEDFQLELEPVGRLDIVAALSKRALDYYNGLPEELRTADTQRNRALAQVRYGYALRNMGRLDEADKALTDAIAVLSRLRDSGDKSENTLVGLGLGYVGLARVKGSQALGAEEEKLSAQGEAALKPLMTGSPSTRVLRAYGLVTNYLGFAQMRQAHQEQAVQTLESSRDAFRRIDGLSMTDVRAVAAYTEAAGWLVDTLVQLGRSDQARLIGEESMRLSTAILDERPGDLTALRSRALLAVTLADLESDAMRVGTSLTFAEAGARDWETFVKLDPRNVIGWNNLMSARSRIAASLFALGRLTEAIAMGRSALSVEKHLQSSPNLLRNLVPLTALVSGMRAELGLAKPAELIPDHHRLSAAAVGGMAPDSVLRQISQAGLGMFDARVLLASGDAKGAQDAAREAIRRGETIKATGAGDVRFQRVMMALANSVLAEAAYAVGAYEESERAARAGFAAREQIGSRIPIEWRLQVNDDRVTMAMAMAKQGRVPEARTIVEPEIAMHRALVKGGSDDAMQRVVMARALIAQAMTVPGARASLSEASSILDALPAEMKRTHTVNRLRAWIATEMSQKS